jgi:predicted metal-dependent phosphoesterase TrpH
MRAANTLNFDLHNHTNASDGTLSSEALVALAYKNGCDALALTDHDTLMNVASAQAVASDCGLKFIAGVEVSVSWVAEGDIDSASKTIHVVGLNVDPNNQMLLDGLAGVRGGRIARGREMARLLVEAGVPDIFEEAFALAENKDMLSRTHFARALVARGVVKDISAAFKRFLSEGNPGYIAHQWSSLPDAMRWILAAGGVAVIAHPGRYKLDRAGLASLFSEFKTLGGQSIEVVTGSHSPDEYAPFASRCKEFGFYASRGADFHGFADTPVEPGHLPTLAEVDRDLKPVWSLFH